MSKNKITVEFKGFEEAAEKLDRAGGDIRKAVEQCLNESAKLVNSQLHAEMKRHYRTGRTEASIMDNSPVEWNGPIGSINVGFDLTTTGLPSIFLMYGTPKIAKDQKLYNAVYGTATKRKVAELQERIFNQALANL